MEAGGAAGGAAAGGGVCARAFNRAVTVQLVIGLALAAYTLYVATEAYAVITRNHGLLMLLSAGGLAAAVTVNAFARDDSLLTWTLNTFALAVRAVTAVALIIVVAAP